MTKDIMNNTYKDITEVQVKTNITGYIVFIITEVIIFTTLIWAYIHSSTNTKIITMNITLPTINTIILITSYISISIVSNIITRKRITMDLHKRIIKNMIITITLGIIFTVIQYIEYKL
jgi:heme/copper-type cytochrome/quinol oxidase subunit 3